MFCLTIFGSKLNCPIFCWPKMDGNEDGDGWTGAWFSCAVSFCACLSHQLLQILDHTGCTFPVDEDEDEVGMVEQEPQSLVVPSVRVDPALSVMAQPSVSLSSADTPTPILFPATTRLSPLSTIHSCQTMGFCLCLCFCFVVFSLVLQLATAEENHRYCV